MLLPPKGRPALWLVVSLTFAVLLVFAGLLFAAGAQAQEANTPEVTTEAPAGETTPESGAPPVQTTSPTGEQTPPTGEQAPPATEPTPSTSEAASAEAQQPQPAGEYEQSPAPTEELASPTQPTPPATEDPPPTSEPPPPVTENPPPTSEPPPVAEQTPPTSEQTAPVAENPPPTSEPPSIAEEAPLAHEQQTTEKQTGKTGGETSPGEPANEETGNSSTPTATSGSDRKEPAGGAIPVPPTPTLAPNVSTATPVASMPAKESHAAVTPESSTSSARRQARQISRELAAFGASIIATGTVNRWLDAPGTSSVSTIAFATIAASPATVITAGALAHNRNNDSAIASYAPGPGPAPGGAGGGAAAAGASSGAASPASFILTNSLLHSAPSVMLQLCVSQPSWRTSFFVLIPERPG